MVHNIKDVILSVHHMKLLNFALKNSDRYVSPNEDGKNRIDTLPLKHYSHTSRAHENGVHVE